MHFQKLKLNIFQKTKQYAKILAYFLILFPNNLNMKNKVCLIVFLLLLIVCVSLFLPKTQEYDYLRLHIRANSNLAIDQNVKYEVKACVVEYLTPIFCNVKSKNEAVNLVEKHCLTIKSKCDAVLREKGFNYVSNVKVNNEYFPTRTYQNTTLESGYYDAVIIELGEAQGDNWWCVMYPPLCFVNKNENNMQIKYESKIWEWIKSLFG